MEIDIRQEHLEFDLKFKDFNSQNARKFEIINARIVIIPFHWI